MKKIIFFWAPSTSREFAQFLTSHPVSLTYLDWSRDTNMPEEHVVHTLRETTDFIVVWNEESTDSI